MENEICKEKTTAPDTSVGADDGQSLYNSTENSIPVFDEETNQPTKILRKVLKKSIVRCAAWQTRTICTRFP